MGVVDESEFDAELNRLGVCLPKNNPTSDSRAPDTEPESTESTIVDIQKGRGKGSKEVPESLRALIGLSAVEDGRQAGLQLAETFGISNSSVSAYTKGATSTATYNEPSEELKAHLDKKKLEIQKRASSKLFKALSHITTDKLENAKAKDLSAVAKDMSVIIRNMEPELVVKQGGGNQFVLYAPIQLKEDSFDVIRVNEQFLRFAHP